MDGTADRPGAAAAAGIVDTREQRGLALQRLAQANYAISCALGYLANSDKGSGLVDDVRKNKDQLEELMRMLEWRQRTEATP